MNTRLQVEHPVTELITGTDLVEWQFRVSIGQKLPMTQEEINKRLHGTAIEARIYAENPLNNFLPGSGYLAHLRTPLNDATSEPGIRVDSGVISGNTVSTFYDPMIAKLIVFGENRQQAIEKLERSLRNFQVAGLPNNVDFLIKVIRHEGFSKHQPTTGFFDKYMNEILHSLVPQKISELNNHAVIGLVTYLKSLKPSPRGSVFDGNGEFNSWRSVRNVSHVLSAQDSSETVPIKLEIQPPNKISLSVQDKKKGLALLTKDVELVSCELVVDQVSENQIHSKVYKTSMVLNSQLVYSHVCVQKLRDHSHVIDVWIEGQTEEQATHYHFKIPTEVSTSAAGPGSSNPVLLSPMPGKIVKIQAKDGSQVKKGEPVVILEAMKMEHVVSAPFDG